MSKCSAAQAVAEMEYWIGYKEKASRSYAETADKSAFDKNAGSANYTYPGYVCGVQAQPWCAAMVSTAILRACGGSKADAKAVLHGVWPYTVCNQVYDAAPSGYKGRRSAWTPKAGDIIVFTDDGTTRTHTGLVYAVDNTYVYTIEGNSGNMCRKRSYLRTSSYIYGYVRPAYAAGSAVVAVIEQYGAICCKDPELHVLSKGTAGPEVKTIQRIIYARGIDRTLSVDGEFGPKTKAGVIELQKQLGITQDGVVGAKTWPAVLKRLA